MRKKIKNTVFSLVFIVLIVSSCSRSSEIQGYMFRPDDVAGLTIGKTTKEDVMKRFGSPSSKSDFGPETWFYVSKKIKSVAFFEPKTLDQNVLALEFNGETLSSIKKTGLDEAKNIAFSKDYTPTEGNTIGFFEQILGNVGKFNKSESAKTPSANLPGR